MDLRNHVVKATEKRHKTKWFQASLNATDKLGSKKTVHYANYKLAFIPLNVEHLRFQDQV